MSDLFSCRACGREDHGCKTIGLKIVSINHGWRVCNVVHDVDSIFPGAKTLAFLCSDVCQARYAETYTLTDVTRWDELIGG